MRPPASVLFAAALLGGCRPEAPAFQPPPPPQVTVASPQRLPVPDELLVTGTTRARERVELRPRVQGFVDQRLVEGGRRVDAGALLFRIDPRPFQLLVDQRQAELHAATAAQKLAAAVLERTRGAVQQRAAAKVELERTEAEQAAAAARVALAEAALQSAELDLSFTDVKAPRAGRLSVEVARPGQLVDPQTVLGTLVDDTQVYATMILTERQYAELQGVETTVFADGNGEAGIAVGMAVGDEQGYPHQGHLDRRDNRVDPATGTIALEAVFDNRGGQLLPGMFARLRVVLARPEQWTVPAPAVGNDPQGSFVLVVGADDVVQRRAVQPGGLVAGRRGIEQGLDGSERVVVNGIQRARPGAKVQPQQADQQQPEAQPQQPGAGQGR